MPVIQDKCSLSGTLSATIVYGVPMPEAGACAGAAHKVDLPFLESLLRYYASQGGLLQLGRSTPVFLHSQHTISKPVPPAVPVMDKVEPLATIAMGEGM